MVKTPSMLARIIKARTVVGQILKNFHEEGGVTGRLVETTGKRCLMALLGISGRSEEECQGNSCQQQSKHPNHLKL